MQQNFVIYNYAFTNSSMTQLFHLIFPKQGTHDIISIMLACWRAISHAMHTVDCIWIAKKGRQYFTNFFPLSLIRRHNLVHLSPLRLNTSHHYFRSDWSGYCVLCRSCGSQRLPVEKGKITHQRYFQCRVVDH